MIPTFPALNTVNRSVVVTSASATPPVGAVKIRTPSSNVSTVTGRVVDFLTMPVPPTFALYPLVDNLKYP